MSGGGGKVGIRVRATKFITLALACLLGIGLSPALGLGGPPTNPSVSLIIYPNDDAFVSSMFPDNTSVRVGDYVDIWDLWVGREWISAISEVRVNRAFLKFDLSSIPDGVEITSARLRLYRMGLALQTETTGAPMVKCYAAVDNWDEYTITWNTQPLGGAYLDSYENVAFWNSWDVMSFVQGEFGGDKLASFMLRAENEQTPETSCAIFSSKEYDGYDPRLEITYEPRYGVSISISPSNQSGGPGATLSYVVTVVNTGTVGDNYVLTATDERGWDLSVEPTSLWIAAGQSADAVLRVTVPDNAPSSTEDNVTVVATSQTDPAVSGSSTCKAHVAALLPLRLAPSDDAHVTQRHLDTNYGDKTSLQLRSRAEDLKNGRIFFKFDLLTIPEGSTIIEAKLYLYCWWGKINLYAQSLSIEDDTWSEDTITWNNQPEYGDVLDTVTLTPEARDTWRSWGVTSFVQDEFAGDKVASFGLMAALENTFSWYKFRSKEYDDATVRPYLEVIYTT